MALFGLGKKKGGQAPAAPAAPGSPIDQVMALKQRGMSNDQIIPELERQGYNFSVLRNIFASRSHPSSGKLPYTSLMASPPVEASCSYSGPRSFRRFWDS